MLHHSRRLHDPGKKERQPRVLISSVGHPTTTDRTNYKMSPPDRTEARAKFVSEMLRWAPSVPDVDYEKICNVWLQATGADWVWLWLIDADQEKNSIMQLVAVEPNEKPFVPDKLRNKNGESIAAKALATARPIRVEDINNYHDPDGTSKVCLKAQLTKMGCESLVAVPLLGLPADSPDEEGLLTEFRGVLCLHYRNKSEITPLNDYDLQMMGSFTARTIVNSYYAHQRTILLALERLQHHCLTGEGPRRPVANREYYLDQLVDLISKHLRVKGVSLFYRDSTTDSAVCLASTGVAKWKDGEWRKIPKQALSLLRYSTTESKTGNCMETSEPVFLTDGLNDKDRPQSIELVDGSVERGIPAIIYPIPAKLGTRGNLEPGPALGVIRCKYHFSRYFQEPIFFTAIELEALHFIARQIAPALKILAEQIDRETTVSVTKHELDTPIKMIWDKVGTLRTERCEEDGDWIKVNRYDVLDIGFCGLLAAKLVRQLDAFPGQILDYEPELVDLGSQIIAPIKNMLAHYAKEQKDMRIRFDGFELDSAKRFRVFPDLFIDKMLVSRVVINLLINAVKYGKAGTEIAVIANYIGSHFCIDVSNYGLGITAEEAKHIFTPGFRSPRVRAVGTGLGLFIAQKAMEKHGGGVSLIEGVNPTVFRISFPERLRYRKNTAN